MILYFTNDSRQKRLLVKSNYVEDIYDGIMAFFEDNHIRPRFIQLKREEIPWKIFFGSMSEFFFVEEITEKNKKDLEDFKKNILNEE